MKHYKEFDKIYLGWSDISSLILVTIGDDEHMKSEILDFGSDGDYSAYLVDKDTEIGEHYQLVFTGNVWLKIYDDQELRQDLCAKQIKIYRAGDFGCIIQLIKN